MTEKQTSPQTTEPTKGSAGQSKSETTSKQSHKNASSFSTSQDNSSDIIWREVNRIIFPDGTDPDVIPLYMDFGTSLSVPVGDVKEEDKNYVLATSQADQGTEYLQDRTSIRVPAFSRVSLATYFNAFPASYWVANTRAKHVKLSITLDGAGDIIIFRSSPTGSSNRIESLHFTESGTQEKIIPLDTFGDGGWLWFDVITKENPVVMTNSRWSVDKSEEVKEGSFSIAITTYNRPDYCNDTLRVLANNKEVLKRVDKIYVIDQGTQKVVDYPTYQDVVLDLGDQLSVIEQGNLGGSGGFSRGMLETMESGESDYVLLLDDDVVIEPESLLRSLNFADYTTKRTLVGGHMFNISNRSVINAWAEDIKDYNFMWGPAAPSPGPHDFKRSNLRDTPWLHRRYEVDYNGWWMTLIPVETIESIGLSLPYFIKWDDAEYSIRAKEAGFPTVSLPGAAVWHVHWEEKDDSLDWQAWFHLRNRWVTALMHSPHSHGGNFIKEMFFNEIKHILSMQYSVSEMRLDALNSIFEGPSEFHDAILTQLPEIINLRKEFSDAQVIKDREDYPELAPRAEKMMLVPQPEGKFQGIKAALSATLGQLKSADAESARTPEQRIPWMDAKWWRLAQLDSALVSNADGSGASFYRRDSKHMRDLMKRATKTYIKAYKQWDDLAEQYKEAIFDLASPQMWKETFAASSPKD